MKSRTKKIVAWGCGLPIAFIAVGMLLVLYQTRKTLEYRDGGYTKDYSWNDIEVGTVLRLPRNTPIPVGRYYAVIAFTNGQMTDARILLEGPRGEVPERPEFVSGKAQTVIYRTKSKGEVTLDLSSWMTYPAKDALAQNQQGPQRSPAMTTEMVVMKFLFGGLATAGFVVCVHGLARGTLSLGFGNAPVSRTRSPIRYWSIVGFGLFASAFFLLAVVAG